MALSSALLAKLALFEVEDLASLAENAGVANWTSRGGIAATASQATAANQPIVRTVGGVREVYFDGSNDFLSLGTALGKPGNFTVVVVAAKRTTARRIILGSFDSAGNTASAWGMIDVAVDGVAGSHGWEFGNSTLSGLASYSYGETSTAAFVANEWATHIQRYVAGATAPHIRKGSRVLATKTPVGTATSVGGTAHPYSIGRGGDYNGLYYDGSIRAVAIAREALTDAETDELSGYLAAKYQPATGGAQGQFASAFDGFTLNADIVGQGFAQTWNPDGANTSAQNSSATLVRAVADAICGRSASRETPGAPGYWTQDAWPWTANVPYTTGDQVLRIRARRGFGLAFRIKPTVGSDAGSGYYAYPYAGALFLGRIEKNGGSTELATTPFSIPADARYVIEAEAVGANLRVRIWLDGTPGTFAEITKTDLEWLEGSCGLFAFEPPSSGFAEVDWIRVGINGAALPTTTFPCEPPSNTAPTAPTVTVDQITTTGSRLNGSAFSDPNTGDTHAASRWQVDTENTFGAPLTYDSGAAGEAALRQKSITGLTHNTLYYARVQYQDSAGNWSAWSNIASFKTGASFQLCLDNPNSRAFGAADRVIASSRGRQIAIRVLMEDQAGVMYDLTQRLGNNDVLGVDVSASIDQPVMSASVSLFRSEDLSLFGTLNLGWLDLNRKIVIQTATTAPGTAATLSDYRCIFSGYTDSVDMVTPVRVEARDDFGRLLDRMVDAVRPYGSASPGTPLETVMQAILTDNPVFNKDGSTSVIPLHVSTVYPPPTFNVTPAYNQEAFIGVLEALRPKALKAGGADVRGMWNPDGSYRLTYYLPPRGKTIPDWTVGAQEVLAVRRLSVNNTDIRNIADGWWHDAAGAKQTPPAPRVLTSSRNRHGHRLMRLEEGTDSPIRTETQFTAFLDAAISDLSEPWADLEVEVHFLWAVELHWLIEFDGLPGYFTGPRRFAVVGFRHTLTAGQYRTTLTLRDDKPVGALRQWIQQDRTQPTISTGKTPPTVTA